MAVGGRVALLLLLMVVAHRDAGICSVPVITMVVLRRRIVMGHEGRIGTRVLLVVVLVQAQVAGQGQIDLCLGPRRCGKRRGVAPLVVVRRRRWGGVA